MLRRVRNAVSVCANEARIAFRNPVTAIIPYNAKTNPPLQAQPHARSFDGAKAFAHLEWQCAQGFRIPGTLPHAATLRMICDTIAASGAQVATQAWHQRIDRGPGSGRTFPMTNVYATFGRAPHSGPVEYMVCAHWDTRPVADRDPDPACRTTPVTGANDGASGVAVLLELARTYGIDPPPHPVALAFFDGEDLGEYCYGSRFFARTLKSGTAREWSARAGIVIDMVGKTGLKCGIEVNSIRNAAALWVHVHNRASALGIDGHFGGPEGEIHDDHVFLHRAGIPSILLLDARYPEWHTTHDAPDRCNQMSLQVIGDLLADVTRRVVPYRGTPGAIA